MDEPVLARTILHHLCSDTGCSLEDLPGAMDYITDGKRGLIIMMVICTQYSFKISGEKIGHRMHCCQLHFLKDINSDEFFHVPEDCQHYFLNGLLRHELFSLPKSQCMCSTLLTIFSIQFRWGKTICYLL